MFAFHTEAPAGADNQSSSNHASAAHAATISFSDELHAQTPKQSGSAIGRVVGGIDSAWNSVVHNVEEFNKHIVALLPHSGTSKPLIDQDVLADRKAFMSKLKEPELEAARTSQSDFILLKDAKSAPPKQSADGSSTTYSVTQIGITDRSIGSDTSNSPKYYKRAVDVTIPNIAKNFGSSQLDYHERAELTQSQFDQLLHHDQNASKNHEVVVYAHGVFTYPDCADQEALLLSLTSGHATVNVDWASKTNESSLILGKDSAQGHYQRDYAIGKKSGPKLQPLMDHAVNEIGPDQTDVVGYSHGGMFDARYLRHRVDEHLPKVNTVIMNHPDVPVHAPELYVGLKGGLLGLSADNAFVIGGVHDTALSGAAFIAFNPGERLGTNLPGARALIKMLGATPITEDDRQERSSQHLLNFAGISTLLNPADSNGRTTQNFFNEATETARIFR